jgi:gamma-glutamyl-gamma-aminobutyrate hydrolase PuuD
VILISSRVDYNEKTDELRAALDIGWADLCGHDLLQVSCITEPEKLLKQVNNVTGIILSGGNDVKNKSSDTASTIRTSYDRKLIELAVQKRIPLFAVCFGMQLLGCAYGGRLAKVEGHVSTHHEVYVASSEVIKMGYPQKIKVNSYHTFSLEGPFQLKSGLRPLYCDSDGNIEAIGKPDGSIMGTMWHPERSMDEMCPLFSKWIEGLR